MANTPENLVEISTELPSPSVSQSENRDSPAVEAADTDKPFLSEDSQLKGDTDAHKKAARGGLRGGRPRKDDLPRGTVTRATPIPFPRPAFTVYKNDATNPHQKSKAFYNWWNALPNWAKDRSLLYVYRTWPILKIVQEDEEGNKELSYIDKISGSEPVQDDTDLLHKYGAGSYFMRFNESPGSTVASVWVVNLGAENLLANPPTDRRISDPANQLDMTHPGNSSYIEFLRMRGKLPEQQSKEKAEAEMATVQTMERMADANKELMHEVINMAKDSRKESAPATDALKGALDVVTDGARRSNQMLHETITSIQELRKGGGESGASLEVMLKMAMEIADKLSGKNDADPAIIDELRSLRDRVSKMQDERIASLERRLEERNATPAINPTSQFGTIKEGINAFKEMKSLVDDISGRSGGEGDADGNPGGPAWLRTVGFAMPHVASVISSARDMLAIWQMGKAPGMPTTQPQPQVFQQPQPNQPNPQPHSGPMLVQPNPQPNPQPQPDLSTHGVTFGLPPDVADLLSSIKISFLNYLEGFVRGDRDEDGELLLSGGAFADWFVGGFGEEYFRNIVQFGEPALLQAISMYPPIAQRVGMTGATPEQVKQFVHDFVSYRIETEEPGERSPLVPDTPETPEGGAA